MLSLRFFAMVALPFSVAKSGMPSEFANRRPQRSKLGQRSGRHVVELFYETAIDKPPTQDFHLFLVDRSEREDRQWN